MPAPIALQLYSIRDELNQDFESGIRKIAAMGYAGVEPAGFPGSTPQAAARLFRELDLAVPSAHVALPLGDEKQQTLDTMAALGSTCIVSGLGPDNYLTVSHFDYPWEITNLWRVGRKYGNWHRHTCAIRLRVDRREGDIF